MILTEARQKVRLLADDRQSELFTDTDLDAALSSAQYEALLWAVNAGATLFAAETSVTTNGSGLADLSALRPLKIHSVALSVGGQRSRIQPIQPSDIQSTYPGAQTIIVNATARPTYPASGASAFVWGNGTACPPLDLLMCCLAAAELKVTDNEVLKSLEIRKAEAKAAVQSLVSNPTWTSMPLNSRGGRRLDLGLRWAVTAPDSLVLAY